MKVRRKCSTSWHWTRLSRLAERRAAAAESRSWYRKSLETWTTWNRRGAATPESEHERHKVEHLLALAGRLVAARDQG